MESVKYLQSGPLQENIRDLLMCTVKPCVCERVLLCVNGAVVPVGVSMGVRAVCLQEACGPLKEHVQMGNAVCKQFS